MYLESVGWDRRVQKHVVQASRASRETLSNKASTLGTGWLRSGARSASARNRGITITNELASEVTERNLELSRWLLRSPVHVQRVGLNIAPIVIATAR